MNTFADLADDLPFSTQAQPLPTPEQARAAVLKTFCQPCNKCGGSGNFTGWSGRVVGRCFTCKGAGQLAFKTSPEHRAQAREKAQERRERASDANWDGFAAEHPALAAWMLASRERFPFAASLEEAVRKYGDLTERQLAAAQKCVDASRARQEAREAAIAQAPEVSLGAVERAFYNARQAGIRRPKLTLGDLKLAPAPETGRNAGAIYVTSGEQYLGKVAGGKFLRSRDCSDAQVAEIQALAADPLAAAVAHGKRYGSCAVCSRELSDPVSVERGIGPICAGRFGW